jgi:hypothetical protein
VIAAVLLPRARSAGRRQRDRAPAEAPSSESVAV